MSKLHKVEMFILDIDEEFNDIEDVINYVSSVKYAPSMRVIKSDTKEFEWDDDIIVNKCSCTNEEYKNFFESL